jgi:hypothetical protein
MHQTPNNGKAELGRLTGQLVVCIGIVLLAITAYTSQIDRLQGLYVFCVPLSVTLTGVILLIYPRQGRYRKLASLASFVAILALSILAIRFRSL